jgi:formylglycine-generating enzyme required for sulfatase activity
MVYVKPGQFGMGSPYPIGSEKSTDGDERPKHEVYLDGFWIDKTEVTNAQYNMCVAAGACEAPSCPSDPDRLTFGDDSKKDYPVVCIDWYQAQVYCQWAEAQLPTEAQWEYAARGPDRRIYPWGDEDPTCERAQYADCKPSAAVTVTSFPGSASWVCALNMAGNVSEWVLDTHDDYPNNPPLLSINPTAAAHDTNNVLRGGSWSDHPYHLRTARRLNQNPNVRYPSIGFRCVVSRED